MTAENLVGIFNNLQEIIIKWHHLHFHMTSIIVLAVVELLIHDHVFLVVPVLISNLTACE